MWMKNEKMELKIKKQKTISRKKYKKRGIILSEISRGELIWKN